MEPEDNSLSLVYRDKESLRSIFLHQFLLCFIQKLVSYRVSQKKRCIVIYLPPDDDEGNDNNDKSDHTLSDIHKGIPTADENGSDPLEY